MAGEPREQRCLKSREYYFFNNTNATHRSLLTFQTQQERGSRPKSLNWFWSKNRKFTFYSSRRLCCCSWLLSWDDYLPFGSITVGLFYHNSFARSSSNWTFGVFVIFIRIVVVIFQAKKYSGRAQIVVQQFKFLQAKEKFFICLLFVWCFFFFYIDCCFQLLSSFNLESQSDEKKFPSEEKEVSLFFSRVFHLKSSFNLQSKCSVKIWRKTFKHWWHFKRTFKTLLSK